MFLALNPEFQHLNQKYFNTAVWRFKNGMKTFSDSLVDHLKTHNDIELKTNEECLSIDLDDKSNKVEIKTTKNNYDFDFVISGIYSKR